MLGRSTKTFVVAPVKPTALFDIGYADGITPVLAMPEKWVPNEPSVLSNVIVKRDLIMDGTL